MVSESESYSIPIQHPWPWVTKLDKARDLLHQELQMPVYYSVITYLLQKKVEVDSLKVALTRILLQGFRLHYIELP